MSVGKTLLAQIMKFTPETSFWCSVQRHRGHSGVRRMNYAEQFRFIAFAQPVELRWFIPAFIHVCDGKISRAFVDQEISKEENAVKTQIWCAMSTYILIAIVNRVIHSDVSLYTLVQIHSVWVFENTQISGALQPDACASKISHRGNQLNLFAF